MSITLYYAPRTRAGRPRWLLEELGVPYTLERDAGARKAAHPLGKVPALRDGDLVMFETAAICIYLADKFADRGLAPAIDSPLRGPYLQWMVFAGSELDVGPVDWYDASDDGAKQRAVAHFDRRAPVVSDALAGREYIVGDRFSAADVMIAAVLGWARGAGMLERWPVLLDYGKRLASRPAAKAARAD
ncbi:MAG TPA: glutathione S-transferase [Kofleriaceae bacterium]|jgi:glutathione S-transferase|nr:glutathione S-transferase [Kofleriaceae bacterium]